MGAFKNLSIDRMTQEREIRGKLLHMISDKTKNANQDTIPVEDIKDESILSSDLGYDSLDTVDLILDIEREFNIAIPDEEAEGWKEVVVGRIVEFVVERCR